MKLTYEQMVAVRPGDALYAQAMEQAYAAQALRGGPRYAKKEAPRFPYVLYCSACGGLTMQHENPDLSWEHQTGISGVPIGDVALRFLSPEVRAKYPQMTVESGNTSTCTAGLHGYTSACAVERRRLAGGK